MKNNIYKDLNNLNGNIDDYKTIEMSEFEKAKFKQNFKNKRRINMKKRILKIAAAFILLFGISKTNIGESVYASAKSTLDSVSYSISYGLYGNKKITPYATVIGKTVSKNGIDIKLNECLIDKDQLIISSLVDLNDEKYDTFLMDTTLYINGKKIRYESMTGSMGAIGENSNIFNDTRILNIPDISTKENLDIKIVFSDFTKENLENPIIEEKVKGKWEFEFTSSGAELAKNTKVYNIGKTFEIEGNTFTIDEMTLNSVTKHIYGTFDKEGYNYLIELRGKDNLGNNVLFDLETTNDGEMTFQYEPLFSELSENAEYIDFEIYYSKIPERSGKSPDRDEYKNLNDNFRVNFNK